MRPALLPLFLILCLSSCKNTGEEMAAQNTEQKIDGKMKVVYIGTYTKKEGHVDGKAEGIYTIYQDSINGTIRFGEKVATVTNPSFVITSRDKKNFYAVSELGSGDGESGYIYSFSINPDHSLTEIGRISTESYAPCHISEDATGRYVFVANYMGGVVMVYEKESNGALKKKQKITLEDPENSHPHSVNIATNNKYVYIADLGRNRIYNYILNSETGSLEPHTDPFIQLKEGTGPRHLAFSASQKYVFSINEHSSTITTFKIEDSGALSMLQDISTLPEDFTGDNSTADIHLHPSGKFLYGSNRGHNSITSFRFDETTGQLELIGFTPTKGEKPRNFAISPDGNFMYVANQDSDNISAYKIDPNSGLLQELEDPLEVKTPVCIKFL